MLAKYLDPDNALFAGMEGVDLHMHELGLGKVGVLHSSPTATRFLEYKQINSWHHSQQAYPDETTYLVRPEHYFHTLNNIKMAIYRVSKKKVYSSILGVIQKQYNVIKLFFSHIVNQMFVYMCAKFEMRKLCFI